MFLSPNIANIFEVYTINGSVVIENIAGIESIAKIISESSISINIANNGVAYSMPFFLVKNFSPSNSLETGIILLNNLIILLL